MGTGNQQGLETYSRIAYGLCTSRSELKYSMYMFLKGCNRSKFNRNRDNLKVNSLHIGTG
ncbi:hypothetical protein VCR15J2_340195 [Vibrio coralliirubri]|nr:hypothetical protein VCR15J2_340195 [Vibrio coralliirubri]